MRLHLFRYKCASCAAEYKVGVVPPAAYGEFVLRSMSGSEAYLNGIADPTYDEAYHFIENSPRMENRSPSLLAEILRKIYGRVACDLDFLGEPYQLDLASPCPVCGTQETSWWAATEPPEFVERELNSVSHFGWDSLSEGEKFEVVDKQLAELGY